MEVLVVGAEVAEAVVPAADVEAFEAELPGRPGAAVDQLGFRVANINSAIALSKADPPRPIEAVAQRLVIDLRATRDVTNASAAVPHQLRRSLRKLLGVLAPSTQRALPPWLAPGLEVFSQLVSLQRPPIGLARRITPARSSPRRSELASASTTAASRGPSAVTLSPIQRRPPALPARKQHPH